MFVKTRSLALTTTLLTTVALPTVAFADSPQMVCTASADAAVALVCAQTPLSTAVGVMAAALATSTAGVSLPTVVLHTDEVTLVQNLVTQAMQQAESCVSGSGPTCAGVVQTVSREAQTIESTATSCASGTNDACNALVDLTNGEIEVVLATAENCATNQDTTCNSALSTATTTFTNAVTCAESPVNATDPSNLLGGAPVTIGSGLPDASASCQQAMDLALNAVDTAQVVAQSCLVDTDSTCGQLVAVVQRASGLDLTNPAMANCGATKPAGNYFAGYGIPTTQQLHVDGSYAVITTQNGAVCTNGPHDRTNFTSEWSMVSSGNRAGWAQVGYIKWYGSSTYYFGQLNSGAHLWTRFGRSPLGIGSAHYYYNKHVASCRCIYEIIDRTAWMSSTWDPLTAWPQPIVPSFFGEAAFLESNVAGTSSAPTMYTNLGQQSTSTEAWGLVRCDELAPRNDGQTPRPDGKSWHNPMTSCPSFNVYTG